MNNVPDEQRLMNIHLNTADHDISEGYPQKIPLDVFVATSRFAATFRFRKSKVRKRRRWPTTEIQYRPTASMDKIISMPRQRRLKNIHQDTPSHDTSDEAP
jgi:hypothetical protein